MRVRNVLKGAGLVTVSAALVTLITFAGILAFTFYNSSDWNGSAPIRAVFTTGGTASRLYRRHIEPVCGRAAIPLPSTSAANCRTGLDALLSAYSVLLPYLAE